MKIAGSIKGPFAEKIIRMDAEARERKAPKGKPPHTPPGAYGEIASY